jgi:hypothetical protein
MTQQKHNLKEGLHTGDLKEFVSDLFTVDQYKSKMGNDSDIVVLGFRVKEKHPAMDLVEFIEKGYPYVLDADMSAGEEHDGQYQVFVEMERNPALKRNLRNLLDGISKLTAVEDWKFRYQKAPHSVEFNEQSVMENIPLTPLDYENRIMEIKNGDVQEFFDQGAVDVALESDNTLTFKKPYAGDITAKFISIGEYEDVKNTIPGALSLDESSQSQVRDKFLIRNGHKAVVIQKDRW